MVKYANTWGKDKVRKSVDKLAVYTKENRKNIIWIIYESVTGTYLSVSGYRKETTPLLEKIFKENVQAFNLGL